MVIQRQFLEVENKLKSLAEPNINLSISEVLGPVRFFFWKNKRGSLKTILFQIKMLPQNPANACRECQSFQFTVIPIYVKCLSAYN